MSWLSYYSLSQLYIPDTTVPQSRHLSPASLVGCVSHRESSLSTRHSPIMVGAWHAAFSRALHRSYCFPLLFSHHLSSFARGHSLPERAAETPGCLRLRRPPGTTLSPQEAAVLLPHLLKLYLGPEFISHPRASCFRGKAVAESVLRPDSCYCGKALILKTARKITDSFPMTWMGKKGMTEGRCT